MVPLEEARRLGARHWQDAVFEVVEGRLGVTACRPAAPLLQLGSFRERLLRRG